MTGGPALVLVTGLVMVVPGPSVLFAVRHRLRGGPAAGLWAVLGLESGLTLHVAAACCGLSGLVAASPHALKVLQAAGAAYLVALGVQGLRARPDVRSPQPDPCARWWRIYASGVLVDVLNPKTVLFVLALLPQFFDGNGGPVIVQSLQLGSLVVVTALLCDGGYAALAGRVHRRIGTSPGWAVAGERASGAAFLVLAAVAVLA